MSRPIRDVRANIAILNENIGTLLKLLVAPAIEHGCQEKYFFVVLEWIFENYVVDFLGCFSYQIAHFEGSITIAFEQQSYIFHDETPDLHSFALLCVMAILCHLLDLVVNGANELKYAVGPIIIQIYLESHLVIQVQLVNEMAYLMIFEYQ